MYIGVVAKGGHNSRVFVDILSVLRAQATDKGSFMIEE